jgi:hypothetical protein
MKLQKEQKNILNKLVKFGKTNSLTISFEEQKKYIDDLVRGYYPDLVGKNIVEVGPTLTRKEFMDVMKYADYSLEYFERDIKDYKILQKKIQKLLNIDKTNEKRPPMSAAPVQNGTANTKNRNQAPVQSGNQAPAQNGTANTKNRNQAPAQNGVPAPAAPVVPSGNAEPTQKDATRFNNLFIGVTNKIRINEIFENKKKILDTKNLKNLKNLEQAKTKKLQELGKQLVLAPPKNFQPPK